MSLSVNNRKDIGKDVGNIPLEQLMSILQTNEDK